MTRIGWTPGTHVVDWNATEIDGVRGAPPEAVRPGAEWCWHGTAQRMDRCSGVLELGPAAPGATHTTGAAAREMAARLSGREATRRWQDATALPHEPPRDGFLLTDGAGVFEARVIRRPGGTARLLALSPALPLAGRPLWVMACEIAQQQDPADRRGARPRQGVCGLLADALVATPDGPVPADRLRPGDMVCTRDDGPQPLRWAGLLRLSGAQMRRNPGLRPVRIGAGALGRGVPVEDLRLSPDQPVLLSAPRAGGLFAAPEVLARAADLVDGRAIRFEDAPSGAVYVQLLLARHQILTAGGLDVASYHPADAEPAPPVTSDTPARPPDPTAYGSRARRCLSPGEAALLAA